MTSNGELRLHSLGTVNFNGGTLNVNSLAAVGGKVNFNTGTINFTSAANAQLTTALLDALLGTTHELGPNRTIGGPSTGELALQAPLTITGGSVVSPGSGTITNSSVLAVRGGALTTTTLINNAGKTLLVAGTGAVTATTGITNNGTIVLENNIVPTSGGPITNNGVIRGTGVIGNPVTNNSSVTVNGNDLQFDGAVTNTGTSALISGQNSTLRFLGGLANSASVAFSSGTMDIYGDVTQNVGGRITVTDGGVATFYDDVTIAPGANNIQASSVAGVVSAVAFLGSYNGGTTGGGAAFIEGDHRPGNSPGLVTFGGNVFYGDAAHLGIELGGLARGTQYDAVNVAGAAFLSGQTDLTRISGFVPNHGNSFDVVVAQGGVVGTFDEVVQPIGLPASMLLQDVYQPTVARLVVVASGDFNADGDYNCVDVNSLVAQIASGIDLPTFNLNGDALVDTVDLNTWLARAGAANLPSGNPYRLGDANLDGVVDGSDFVIWNANKFTSVAAWCSGDFTADGVVDGSDFVAWNSNKFTSSDAGTSVVPEPSSLAFPFLGVLVLRNLRRSR